MLVLETPISLSHRKQIVEMATALRLATLYPPRPADPSSALIYGVNFGDVYKHLPAYIDKILKGAKTGDLPVTVLKRYEFVVNAKTARTIGLTIPAEVLKRADKVVDSTSQCPVCDNDRGRVVAPTTLPFRVTLPGQPTRRSVRLASR